MTALAPWSRSEHRLTERVAAPQVRSSRPRRSRGTGTPASTRALLVAILRPARRPRRRDLGRSSSGRSSGRSSAGADARGAARRAPPSTKAARRAQPRAEGRRGRGRRRRPVRGGRAPARGASSAASSIGPEDWSARRRRPRQARCATPARRRAGSRPSDRGCRRAASTAPTPTCRRPRARSTSADRRPGQAGAGLERGDGEALKAAGFDLNLAPVADVATLDSPIADRAFSDDPDAGDSRSSAPRSRAARAPGSPAPSPTSPASAPPPTTPTQPGDGQPRRGLARGPRPLRLPGRVRRRRAGDRPLARLLRGLRPGHPGGAVARDRDRPAARRARLQGGRDHRRPLRRARSTAGIGAPEAAVQALAAGADLVVVDDPVQAGQVRDGDRRGRRRGAGSPSSASTRPSPGC